MLTDRRSGCLRLSSYLLSRFHGRPGGYETDGLSRHGLRRKSGFSRFGALVPIPTDAAPRPVGAWLRRDRHRRHRMSRCGYTDDNMIIVDTEHIGVS